MLIPGFLEATNGFIVSIVCSAVLGQQGSRRLWGGSLFVSTLCNPQVRVCFHACFYTFSRYFLTVRLCVLIFPVLFKLPFTYCF